MPTPLSRTADRIEDLLPEEEPSSFRTLNDDRLAVAKFRALELFDDVLDSVFAQDIFSGLPEHDLQLTMRERMNHIGHEIRQAGHLATRGPVLARDDGTLWVVDRHDRAGERLRQMEVSSLSADELDTLGREIQHRINEVEAEPARRTR